LRGQGAGGRPCCLAPVTRSTPPSTSLGRVHGRCPSRSPRARLDVTSGARRMAGRLNTQELAPDHPSSSSAPTLLPCATGPGGPLLQLPAIGPCHDEVPERAALLVVPQRGAPSSDLPATLTAGRNRPSPAFASVVVIHPRVGNVVLAEPRSRRALPPTPPDSTVRSTPKGSPSRHTFPSPYHRHRYPHRRESFGGAHILSCGSSPERQPWMQRRRSWRKPLPRWWVGLDRLCCWPRCSSTSPVSSRSTRMRRWWFATTQQTSLSVSPTGSWRTWFSMCRLRREQGLCFCSNTGVGKRERSSPRFTSRCFFPSPTFWHMLCRSSRPR
jgi:hypothetical protein